MSERASEQWMVDASTYRQVTFERVIRAQSTGLKASSKPIHTANFSCYYRAVLNARIALKALFKPHDSMRFANKSCNVIKVTKLGVFTLWSQKWILCEVW